jgi:plastocyanin
VNRKTTQIARPRGSAICLSGFPGAPRAPGIRVARGLPLRRGAGLLPFLALVGWLCGCGGGLDEAPPSDPELATVVGLAPGAQLHRVTLGGRGAEEHAVPGRIDAAPGDAVEFRTVDHRVHTVVFPPDSLTCQARSFLEETGQGASPPLVSRGSRFVLRLEGAPSGRYPFVSEGHGGTAKGVVVVGLQPDSLPGDPR